MPDTSLFNDSAHHWYAISDTDKLFQPERVQRRYRPSEIAKIADNILLYQKDNGGWPKNYDMQAVLSDHAKELLRNSRQQKNTTFDNGTTYPQISWLLRTYALTGDMGYRQAAEKGLQFILQAQYDNGGWPQSYPDTSGYRKYITFNDGVMTGILNLLYDISIADKYTDTVLQTRMAGAFWRGIECILKCQIRENGKLLAWGQQHDNITLELRTARTFEPAVISNGESASIVALLMKIRRPDDKIILAVESAVNWFRESAIKGVRILNVRAEAADYKYHKADFDRIAAPDSTAPAIWTRYYEPVTHSPVFCNRDGRLVYSLAEVERERRTGYQWYVYSPADIIREYEKWKTDIKK